MQDNFVENKIKKVNLPIIQDVCFIQHYFIKIDLSFQLSKHFKITDLFEANILREEK